MTNERGCVLVTGARGMLGTDVCEVLRAVGAEVVGADVDEFDVTDARATLDFVVGRSPRAIINCAGYTAVDKAEEERELAFRVNGEGAKHVAEAAREVDAALVHISTDYVFDGRKAGPYREDDRPNPLGAYGASKLAGEEAVRATLARHYIVRTAWLFGPHGKSFPRTVLNARLAGRPLRVVNDQLGSPTYTVHLAAALARMIEHPRYGTYHVANSGSCSWYELASAVLWAAGLSPEVEPITSSEYPTPAPRPANSVLDASKARETFGIRMPSWEDGVVEFADRWKEEQGRGGPG